MIQISGRHRLEQWMKVVSFNNPVHLSKYLIFKKYGFVPPHTTLAERKKILKKKIDPWSYYPKQKLKKLKDLRL